MRYRSLIWIKKHPQRRTIKLRRRKVQSTYTMPYIKPTIKKVSPESIRAIARNPNIDLQSIGIYSKADIQHHIRTPQFQELLTQIDSIQRQSIDQNLKKLAETAGFSDIDTQDCSGCVKDIKDYIYLKGEKK